jgi:hypothetical protein
MVSGSSDLMHIGKLLVATQHWICCLLVVVGPWGPFAMFRAKEWVSKGIENESEPSGLMRVACAVACSSSPVMCTYHPPKASGIMKLRSRIFPCDAIHLGKLSLAIPHAELHTRFILFALYALPIQSILWQGLQSGRCQTP